MRGKRGPGGKGLMKRLDKDTSCPPYYDGCRAGNAPENKTTLEGVMGPLPARDGGGVDVTISLYYIDRTCYEQVIQGPKLDASGGRLS